MGNIFERGKTDGRRGLSVYVCDDDPQLRAVLQSQLFFLGHKSKLSASASAALAELGLVSAHYDVAIIDLQLPDLNGDKVISWLSESELPSVKNLPVLILTGQPDLLPPGALSASWKIKMLTKPYSTEDLDRCLYSLVGDGLGQLCRH
ncbi:MAG: response regulator [Pseudomonadota bacterium]